MKRRVVNDRDGGEGVRLSRAAAARKNQHGTVKRPGGRTPRCDKRNQSHNVPIPVPKRQRQVSPEEQRAGCGINVIWCGCRAGAACRRPHRPATRMPDKWKARGASVVTPRPRHKPCATTPQCTSCKETEVFCRWRQQRRQRCRQTQVCCREKHGRQEGEEERAIRGTSESPPPAKKGK
jgi:hypothetical protein